MHETRKPRVVTIPTRPSPAAPGVVACHPRCRQRRQSRPHANSRFWVKIDFRTKFHTSHRYILQILQYRILLAASHDWYMSYHFANVITIGSHYIAVEYNTVRRSNFMKQGFHQYFRQKLHIYMLVQGRSGIDLTNKILSDDFNEFFLNNVHKLMGRISDNLNRNNSQYSQCPILLIWINFNPSMDKRLGYQIDDYNSRIILLSNNWLYPNM